MSSDGASEKEDFSDWASSLHGANRTKSLFDDSMLDSAQEALEYDARVHNWSLDKVGIQLGLTDYQRIMLINHIRRNHAASSSLANLSIEDALFSDDANLKPEIEDDPMLQLAFDDSWSDDEMPLARSTKARQTVASTSTTVTPQIDGNGPKNSDSHSEPPSDLVLQLRAELAIEQSKVKKLQELIARDLEGSVAGSTSEGSRSSSEEEEIVFTKVEKGKGKAKETRKEDKSRRSKGKTRDDDTHYFDSYASNDIHEIMLKDAIRTVSYGRFILSNSKVFKDAIVMDVGCGTGILSMFAARAGAKKIYAIEASGLAAKARENIKNNGFQDVIVIIQSKVEDITLDLPKVDVIISEWMGYMLLYEAMLDSVLYARDKYLKADGLMVPSQTRIVIAASTAERLHEEGFGFWDKVYGFDLSAMKPRNFQEGIVDVAPADEITTNSVIIKDINSHLATSESLDFQSTFSLFPSQATGSTIVRAFVAWFDTFFSPDSATTGQVQAKEEVQLQDLAGWKMAPSIDPVDEAKRTSLSFTTGPQGQATHWKQVTFMLGEAVTLSQGQSIVGEFRCQKSKTNSRELDVEIHWSVQGEGEAHNRPRYSVFMVC